MDHSASLCLVPQPRIRYQQPFVTSQHLLAVSQLKTELFCRAWRKPFVISTCYLEILVICEYAITYAYFAKTSIHFQHIMAFSKSHMRKLCRICNILKNSHIFARVSHISTYAITFFQHFLSNVVLRLLNIFGGKWLPVFTIRR